MIKTDSGSLDSGLNYLAYETGMGTIGLDMIDKMKNAGEVKVRLTGNSNVNFRIPTEAIKALTLLYDDYVKAGGMGQDFKYTDLAFPITVS